LDDAKGYFYWLADRARAKYDMHTTEGQVAVLKFLMPAVQRISDRMERMVVAGDLAAYVGVERGLVLDTFKKSVAERQEKKFEIPRTPLRFEELALLNGLLADTELAAETIPELKTLEAVKGFASHTIFQAMFAIDEAGGRISFDAVNARLEERDQAQLAGAVLNCDLEITREAIAETMARLRLSGEQIRRAQWKTRVKELERAGRWEEALRAMEELRAMERARP
jgi:biotin operon repressor